MTTETKKSQNLKIILIVLGALIVICCICPAVFSVIGQATGLLPKMTPTFVANVSAIQTAAFASSTSLSSVPTEKPTRTSLLQLPTQAPLPIPTPQPEFLPMDLGQFMDKYNNLTDIQKEDFRKQIKGQWVSWEGVVLEVGSDARITVSIPGTLLSSLSLTGVSHDQAMQITKKQNLKFTGHIRDIVDMLGLHIYIDQVQIVP